MASLRQLKLWLLLLLPPLLTGAFD